MKHLILQILIFGTIICLLLTFSKVEERQAKYVGKYTQLFNGKNFEGWILETRTGGQALAEKVFSVGDNGEVHVYKDFEDGFQLNSGTDTHGMMWTKESFSRYSFKFEYKWGKKIFSNFDEMQYDAGCYYHVFEQEIWPSGLEYQVRYNHLTDENHTGDFWAANFSLIWFEDSTGKFLAPYNGGKSKKINGGELRCLDNVDYHALDGEWNQCEIIVMSDKYAIHKLNGKVVNFATNLSQSEGTIGLQSETAELMYRNIMIKEFESDIPVDSFILSSKLVYH